MAGFLGMTVQVTLKSSAILHGKVRDVVAGQTLTLDDAFVPATGDQLGLWTVQGTAIADLQVIDATPTPTSAIRTTAPAFPPTRPPQHQTSAPRYSSARPPHLAQHPPPPLQPVPTPQRQSFNFIDPAILSYGKSPAPIKTVQAAPVEAPATPVKSMLAKAAESLPGTGSPFVAEPGSVSLNSGSNASRTPYSAGPQQAPDGTPVEAVESQDAVDEATEEAAHVETGGKSGKRTRRGQKKKVAGPPSSDPPPVLNIEVSRNGNDMNGSAKRGKGWRQTPLLQPSPQAASPVGKSTASRQTRRQREESREMQENGWATEDATDVQEAGDFDFEASNKLFDKKSVFVELRREDTTADEDRLVNHNKLPSRPGTHGGKNLHPTENVLSPKVASVANGSHDASSSSDADIDLNLPNGRSSSRHSVTRSVLGKKAPSRQNSNQADVKPHPLAASMSSDRSGVVRSVKSLSSRQSNMKPAPSTVALSPSLDRTRSPVSITKTSAAQEPHLVIQHTLSTCPVLHPNALSTLEAETISRYGLSQDAITETAARAIAEAAMSIFELFHSSRRGSRTNTLRGSMTSSMTFDRSQPPVVVILAGNHAVGARAVAAARHLSSRRCKVIVAEALYESRETQDEQMQAQTAMLKRLQRAGANIKRGAWRKASNYIKNLTGPPAIIIDALLAGATYESLLGPNAQYAATSQQEAREMIDWANRSRAAVLSIGCPSGVSGRDGSATVVDGEPLAVRPERVLCLGAPMQGLLEAMRGGERWELLLADVGFNITLRSEEAVDFGAQWVVELRYLEDEAVDEVA
ncbi:enhancer of mRNA decapping [Teratosphaeriaceae sp. CCFEE 6253]|nr:enhancer of mRNA decapping [Teratosphaeriaceae sp. CCFEE 6253]